MAINVSNEMFMFNFVNTKKLSIMAINSKKIKKIGVSYFIFNKISHKYFPS